MHRTPTPRTEGRATPQPVPQMKTSVWGVAAASTAFGGPGGTGYYSGSKTQPQGGVAAMGASGAAQGMGSQQTQQSDLHVPVKKWVKKWEGSKYTPQMIGLTAASQNIPRTKADADALRLYRWIQTDEIVGERNEDTQQHEGNEVVDNLEEAAGKAVADEDGENEEEGEDEGEENGDGDGGEENNDDMEEDAASGGGDGGGEGDSRDE